LGIKAAPRKAAIFSNRCINFQSLPCINLHPLLTTFGGTLADRGNLLVCELGMTPDVLTSLMRYRLAFRPAFDNQREFKGRDSANDSEQHRVHRVRLEWLPVGV
jgi:hypothetical protein